MRHAVVRSAIAGGSILGLIALAASPALGAATRLQVQPLPAETTVTTTAPVSNNNSTVRFEATAGLAGFVDPDRPVDVEVTIEADVLFAGWLEVRSGSTLIKVPVEVPAGGSKTYTARMPSPVGSVQTRIRLFNLDEETLVLASQNISFKTPDNETIVAIVGSQEIARTIEAATIGLTDGEVVAVTIESDRLEAALDPASYLVIDKPLTLPDPTVAWIRAGGRVITDDVNGSGLGLDLGIPLADGDRTAFRMGDGYVFLVPGLDSIDPDGWSAILLPTPVQIAPRDVWQSPEMQLMQSAANGGDQRIPSLPWLLAALVGYAVVVGPVNFFILARLGRRELAWMTVPVLSVLAVAGFWLAGRQRLQSVITNHATVVIAGSEHVEARTALVIASGSAGARTLTVPSDWDTYPASLGTDMNGMPIPSVVAEVVADGEYRFALEQLGSAGILSWWKQNRVDLPTLEFSRQGNALIVAVSNDGPYEFWAWGLVGRGRVQVSPDLLSAGASGEASVTPGGGGVNEFGTVGDAVIQSRQLFNDPNIWNKIGSLGYAAAPLLDGQDVYFFGFTDQLAVPIEIDGRATAVAGSSLVVIPIDLGEGSPEFTSAGLADLLDTGDASWVDVGPGYLSLSTRQMTIGWNLPTNLEASPSLQVNNMFGELPPKLEAYNWPTASFDRIDNGDRLDLGLYRSPLGQVVVRANAADDPAEVDNFFELAMSPYAFTLSWA